MTDLRPVLTELASLGLLDRATLVRVGDIEVRLQPARAVAEEDVAPSEEELREQRIREQEAVLYASSTS